MAVNRCKSCGTLFAIGLTVCPHCRSVQWEEDSPMPKITKAGGPSVHGARMVGGEWVAEATEGKWLTPDMDETEPATPFEEPAPVTEDADGADEAAPAPPAAGPYDKLTVDELKAALTGRGLPKTGKRDVLVQRLTDADAEET